MIRHVLAALLAWASLGLGLAIAQTQPVPPEHYTLDERGVDLVRGAFTYVSEEVAIGPRGQGGIAYGRIYTGEGWRDLWSGSIAIFRFNLHCEPRRCVRAFYQIRLDLYASIQHRWNAHGDVRQLLALSNRRRRGSTLWLVRVKPRKSLQRQRWTPPNLNQAAERRIALVLLPTSRILPRPPTGRSS